MESADRFLVELTFSAKYPVPVSCNDDVFVIFSSFVFVVAVEFGSELNCQDFVALGRVTVVLLEAIDVELLIIELEIITFDVSLVGAVAFTMVALVSGVTKLELRYTAIASVIFIESKMD